MITRVTNRTDALEQAQTVQQQNALTAPASSGHLRTNRTAGLASGGSGAASGSTGSDGGGGWLDRARDWTGDRIGDAQDWAGDRIDDAQDWVGDRIDDARALGNAFVDEVQDEADLEDDIKSLERGDVLRVGYSINAVVADSEGEITVSLESDGKYHVRADASADGSFRKLVDVGAGGTVEYVFDTPEAAAAATRGLTKLLQGGSPTSLLPGMRLTDEEAQAIASPSAISVDVNAAVSSDVGKSGRGKGTQPAPPAGKTEQPPDGTTTPVNPTVPPGITPIGPGSVAAGIANGTLTASTGYQVEFDRQGNPTALVRTTTVSVEGEVASELYAAFAPVAAANQLPELPAGGQVEAEIVVEQRIEIDPSMVSGDTPAEKAANLLQDPTQLARLETDAVNQVEVNLSGETGSRGIKGTMQFDGPSSDAVAAAIGDAAHGDVAGAFDQILSGHGEGNWNFYTVESGGILDGELTVAGVGVDGTLEIERAGELHPFSVGDSVEAIGLGGRPPGSVADGIHFTPAAQDYAARKGDSAAALNWEMEVGRQISQSTGAPIPRTGAGNLSTSRWPGADQFPAAEDVVLLHEPKSNVGGGASSSDPFNRPDWVLLSRGADNQLQITAVEATLDADFQIQGHSVSPGTQTAHKTIQLDQTLLDLVNKGEVYSAANGGAPVEVRYVVRSPFPPGSNASRDLEAQVQPVLAQLQREHPNIQVSLEWQYG